MHKTHTPFRWLFLKKQPFSGNFVKNASQEQAAPLCCGRHFQHVVFALHSAVRHAKKKNQYASAAALKSQAGRDSSETLRRASLSAGSLLAPGALLLGHCARCFSPQVRGAFWWHRERDFILVSPRRLAPERTSIACALLQRRHNVLRDTFWRRRNTVCVFQRTVLLKKSVSYV